MAVRLATFLIWALTAGSAVFWALRLWTSPVPVPAATAAAPDAPLRGDVQKVLGRAPATLAGSAMPAPAAALSSQRYRLLGVVAPQSRGGADTRGLALISIDGAPARAFREGSRVEGAQWLLRVEPKRVQLGTRAQEPPLVLELPDPSPAAGSGVPSPAAAALPAAARPSPGGAPRQRSAGPLSLPNLTPPAAAPPETAPVAGISREGAYEAGADTASVPVPMRRPGPALR